MFLSVDMRKLAGWNTVAVYSAKLFILTLEQIGTYMCLQQEIDLTSPINLVDYRILPTYSIPSFHIERFDAYVSVWFYYETNC